MRNQAAGDHREDTWRETLTQALSLLAPFSQVRLTPQLPTGSRNGYLSQNLPIQDDEHLLAVIDCGQAGSGGGFCSLTSHRISWPDQSRDELIPASHPRERDFNAEIDTVPLAPGEDPYATTSITASASGVESKMDLCSDRNQSEKVGTPRHHSVEYRAIPAEVGRIAVSNQINLGQGQTLVLPGAEPQLVTALGRYLAIMGNAARTYPNLTEADRHKMASGGTLYQMSPSPESQDQTMLTDLEEFHRSLDAATPVVIITPAMCLACIVVFAVMVISGIPVFHPTAMELLAWGANDGARVMLRHEFWRLLSSVFIHGGLIHLVVNLWSLMVIGRLVERIYGHLAFGVIYLSAGIGGAIASAVIPPIRVSIGASAAICGVLGALVAFLWVNHRTLASSVLNLFRRNLAEIAGFMVLLGILVPNTDHAAHLGGLATGFVSGLLLYRAWPIVPSWKVGARQLAMTVVIAAGLSLTSIVATRYGQTFVPPERQLRDILDQINQPYSELQVIKKDTRALAAAAAAGEDQASPVREQTLRGIHELTARARGNLERFRHTTTPDPELRAMADTLMSAQREQIRLIEALNRFYSSGNRADLLESREADSATNQALREFQRLPLAYQLRHGLQNPVGVQAR